MPARKPTTAPKAPGRNVEEWERSGCKVQFRLTEPEAKALTKEATAQGLTPNALATRWVREMLPPRELTAAEEQEAYAADQRHDHDR